MYNHYMDGAFAPLGQAATSAKTTPTAPRQKAGRTHQNDLFGDVTGSLSKFLGGFGKHFSLNQLDTGDILLVLIILFLFLEGDNLELVITLGLMLLFGLNDD